LAYPQTLTKIHQGKRSFYHLASEASAPLAPLLLELYMIGIPVVKVKPHYTSVWGFHAHSMA
jgi:hypothetical protein